MFACHCLNIESFFRKRVLCSPFFIFLSISDWEVDLGLWVRSPIGWVQAWKKDNGLMLPSIRSRDIGPFWVLGPEGHRFSSKCTTSTGKLFRIMLNVPKQMQVLKITSFVVLLCCCFRTMTGFTGNGCASCVASCSTRTSTSASVSCAASVWIATSLWSILYGNETTTHVCMSHTSLV